MDALEQSLVDAGSGIPFVTAIGREAESTWTVHFDGGRVVTVAWRESPDRVETAVDIGELPGSCAAEVSQALLMFNALSAQTGGARMAVQAPDNAIVLIQDLPAPLPEVAELRDRLSEAHALGEKWSEWLASVNAAGLAPSSRGSLVDPL